MIPNNSEKALVTGLMNLPGITVTQNTAQYQLYQDEMTVLGAYLEFRKAADALMTDAELVTDVASIEVWDGDAQIVRPLTPAECVSLYNHYHSKDGAYAANSGTIPLPLLPEDYPLALTRAHFGLGRRSDDGSGVAKLKIIVTWKNVVPACVTCIPTVVFDPTERMAPLGRHFRVDKFTYTEAGTGERKVADIFRDTNAISCKELLVNTVVGTVTNITVKQGTELRYYQTRPNILAREEHKAGLTAIANRQSVLFNALNDPSSQLTLRGRPPVELVVNWSGAPGASDILRVMEYEGRVTW